MRALSLLCVFTASSCAAGPGDAVSSVPVEAMEDTGMPLDESDTEGGADDTASPGPTGELPTVSPGRIQLGDVQVGCLEGATLTITNPGPSSRDLRSLLITGARFPRFSLDPDRPTVLPPQRAVEVGIRFRAEDAGPHQAAVALYLDEDVLPFAEVGLQAQARSTDPCPVDTDDTAP